MTTEYTTIQQPEETLPCLLSVRPQEVVQETQEEITAVIFHQLYQGGKVERHQALESQQLLFLVENVGRYL